MSDTSTKTQTTQKLRTPMFVFLSIYFVLSIIQIVLLWSIKSPSISDANFEPIKNRFSNDWLIALGVLLAITLVLGLIYLFVTTIDFSRIVFVWFILMIIVNLIFLGFLFYFLSVILGSSDYQTPTGPSVAVRNLIIGNLVFTSVIIIFLIIAIIYYNKYKGSSKGFKSFFGGDSDVTYEQWLNIKNNTYGSQGCKQAFERFGKDKPYIDKAIEAFGEKALDNPDFKSFLQRYYKLTPQQVEEIGNPSSP